VNRQTSGKGIIILLGGYTVGLILFLLGYIGVVEFLSLPVVLLFLYVFIAWMYPYFKVAGRTFLAVFMHFSPLEADSIFALVEEVSQPEWIISTIPAEVRKRDIIAVFAKVTSFPFLPTATAYDGVILLFDPMLFREGKQTPDTIFQMLTYDDYISPTDVRMQIPIKLVAVSGVVIGEYSKERVYEERGFLWRLLAWIKRRKEVVERYPIVFVTWSKLHDRYALTSLRKGLTPDKILLTTAGFASVVDKAGFLRVRDTTERSMVTELEMCKQKLETLDKVIIKSYEPEIAFSHLRIIDADKPLARLRIDWVKAVGIGILLGSFVLFIMYLAGWL